MLEGTTRSPGDVVATVPPDLAECTVEKVAVNAVMAGCRPEYLPVVIAAVEAVCTDEEMVAIADAAFEELVLALSEGPDTQ